MEDSKWVSEEKLLLSNLEGQDSLKKVWLELKLWRIKLYCNTYILVNREKLVTQVKPRWKKKMDFRGPTSKPFFSCPPKLKYIERKTQELDAWGDYQSLLPAPHGNSIGGHE